MPFVESPRFPPHASFVHPYYDTVFDFSALGLNLDEPDVHKALREAAMANPLLASFMEDMPEALGFALSPMTIEAQAERL